MAETRKVLGQLAVPNGVLTALYTVPAATQVVGSTFIITNTTAVAKRFRLSIGVAGAADNIKQYIYYDQSVSGNTSFASTIGFTLGALDVVRVYANAGGLSASLFGVEIT